MIEVKNLTKKYGSKTVLDNVSFTVENGEVLGFLGPNGAGKSTTLNIITGYISSTEGSVTIDGIDIMDDSIAYKKKIGYLPEIPPLYTDMKVWEYLDFVCDLKKADKNSIDKILEEVKITDVKDYLIRNLSKGYRQRVGIAQALIGDPEILILDEPTVGLDPMQIIDIRGVISELGKKRTLIISSHILSEISAVCSRVLIINKGKIIASGKLNHVKNLHGLMAFLFAFLKAFFLALISFLSIFFPSVPDDRGTIPCCRGYIRF